MSQTAPGKKWTVEIMIAVVDNLGDSVSNATVTGDWSGGASGTDSCTTDAIGHCAISKGGLKSNVSSVIFTVSGIAHASLNYDDSGASTITVVSPY
jgi:hypothetical protein